MAPFPSLRAADCSWAKVTAPNPGGRETLFLDIDGVGEDLWTVGTFKRHRQPARTLAEHLTPEGWQVIPTPNRNQRDNALAGVRYLATDDVWAVGSAAIRDGGARNLITHWDGTTWQMEPAPTSGRGVEALYAVDASPPGDIPNPLVARQMWAVGVTSTRRGGQARPSVLHYDGAAWNLQALPTLDGESELRSVVVFSDTDVWAAGIQARSGAPRPLVMHYDGTAWSKVPTPNPGAGEGGSFIVAIAGTGPTDLYAVGLQLERSLVMHFDGTAWTVETTPATSTNSADGLQAVDIQSSGEVWGVGFTIGGSFTFETLAQHRTVDGTWSNQTTPDPGDFNALLSVLALDEGPVWAAGFFQPTGTRKLQNLLLRCG